MASVPRRWRLRFALLAAGWMGGLLLVAQAAGQSAEKQSQAPATSTHNFDGQWLTTVSCANYRGALGYAYQFVGTVKDGKFHGLHGTEGQPGSLVIDGPIAADGKASLSGNGRTGSKEYVPGRETPRGTEYSYNIDAQFAGATGTGERVEGRPCSFKFAKQ
jgi:hypothetical protein